ERYFAERSRAIAGPSATSNYSNGQRWLYGCICGTIISFLQKTIRGINLIQPMFVDRWIIPGETIFRWSASSTKS
ncbi:hypothetical protein MPER_02746, partial [Moniliophthora perniciosa FA553]